MKYLAVFDTNILVSHLLSNDLEGTINQLMKYVRKGKVIPIYTNDIYDEYLDVLNRKEFGFLRSDIGHILNMIKKYGIKINCNPADGRTIDPKDQIFYDAVMTKRDDDAYLVTGNLKHFPLKDFIVSAKQMLNIILNRYA